MRTPARYPGSPQTPRSHPAARKTPARSILTKTPTSATLANMSQRQLTSAEFRELVDLCWGHGRWWDEVAELTGRNARTLRHWYTGNDPRFPELPADFTELILDICTEIAEQQIIKAGDLARLVVKLREF